MKLHYYPRNRQSCTLSSNPDRALRHAKLRRDSTWNLDANGEVAGFDIDHASKRLDLSTLEIEALPARTYRVG